MFIVVLWVDESKQELFMSYMSKHPWESLSTELERYEKWKPYDSWTLKRAVGVDLSLLPGETSLEFNSVLDTEPSKRRFLWTEIVAAELGHLRLNPVSGDMRIYDLEKEQWIKRPLHAARMQLAAKNSSPDRDVLDKLVACAAELHSQN